MYAETKARGKGFDNARINFLAVRNVSFYQELIFTEIEEGSF